MANEYSVEIHKYLSEKIAIAKKAAEGNPEDSPRFQGQLKELLWIREYLSNNTDLKDFKYY